MSTIKAKVPLLAVLLTCQLPGLGHVYARRVKRGIIFFALPTLVNIFLLGYALHPQTKIYASLLLLIPFFLAYTIYIMLDAHRCAKQWNEAHNVTRVLVFAQKALLVMSIIVSFFGINVSAFLSQYVAHKQVRAFKISSGTMMPTLLKGDRVLANKALYRTQKPQRGDVLVFIYPVDQERVFLKRLIAFEGETVEIREGDVYINDQLIVDERIKKVYYLNNGQYAQSGQSFTVPEGQLYVLGDNSAQSSDSRFWGFVPESYVLGKVYKIYWPPERSGPLE
jgi:signal peptidase I